MEQKPNSGKLEGFLAEFGRMLDQLLDKARHGAEEAKLSDKFDELKQTKNKLENELNQFVQDDEKWREVKNHLQGAAQELQRAFETTFTRKPGDSNQAGSANYNNSSNSGQGNWGSNPEQRSADWQENNPATVDWNNRRNSDTTDPGANTTDPGANPL